MTEEVKLCTIFSIDHHSHTRTFISYVFPFGLVVFGTGIGRHSLCQGGVLWFGHLEKRRFGGVGKPPNIGFFSFVCIKISTIPRVDCRMKG